MSELHDPQFRSNDISSQEDELSMANKLESNGWYQAADLIRSLSYEKRMLSDNLFAVQNASIDLAQKLDFWKDRYRFLRVKVEDLI